MSKPAIDWNESLGPRGWTAIAWSVCRFGNDANTAGSGNADCPAAGVQLPTADVWSGEDTSRIDSYMCGLWVSATSWDSGENVIRC